MSNSSLNRLAAAVAVAVVALLSNPLAIRAEDGPKPELPDGMKGFAGELSGEVVIVVENGFMLKVKEVKQGEKGKAQNPQVAVGKNLLINVAWVKQGEKWVPVGPQLAWVKLLKGGDSVRVWVKNLEGDRLHILELNADQRKQLEQAEKERKEAELRDKQNKQGGDPVAPGNNGEKGNKGDEQGEGLQDLRGFAGQFDCKVIEIGDGKLLVELVNLVQVWKHNKAGNCRAAVGKRVVVWLRLNKDGDKKVVAPLMAAWLRGVKVGQNVRLDLKDDGNRLWLVELNEEQRQQAEKNK